MNSKEFKIASILVDRQRPVTSQTLSEQLSISSRTVKRSVWVIDEELRENGAGIVSNKNGYEIEIYDKSRFDEYWNRQRRTSDDMSMENDIELEVMKQLFLNKYCTQDELADITYVSRSTINKYIKDIKEILEAENIKLGNRPHFGYFLVGRESDIRNFMVKLFLSDTGFSTVDGSLVEGCRDFTGFIRELKRFLTSFGLELNDHRTVSIMKYFIITANRIENKCLINGEVSKTDSHKEFGEKAHQMMERYYGIDLNNNEISYLIQVVGLPDDDSEKDLAFYDGVVTEFLTEIKEVYQQNFFFDPVLRQGLVQHLYSCYGRMLINTVVDNPLIQVIKTQYVEAYNYAVLCGNVLRDKYGIEPTEDSLGYIALHFAAAIERINSLYKFNAVIVCDSGFGMSELLKMSITNRIKNIEVVKTVSTRQLYETDLSNIAMVITSVKLDRKLNKPVLFVDPLQLENDINKIDSYIKDYINIPQYKKLFSAERFYPGLKLESKEEILTYLEEDLYRKGVIGEKNIAEFARREKMGTTEINKYVAIPHCIVETNNETSMAIATLSKPVTWGKEKVSIVLVACIARKSTLNRKLFPLLFKLTMDSEKCQNLTQIRQFDEFVDLLFSNLPVDYND